MTTTTTTTTIIIIILGIACTSEGEHAIINFLILAYLTKDELQFHSFSRKLHNSIFLMAE
jgi:hypothetical protein